MGCIRWTCHDHSDTSTMTAEEERQLQAMEQQPVEAEGK